VSRLAVVRATVSQPGTLSIRLLRGGRTLRRATAPLAAGVNRIPLAVRGLRRGSYRVRLEARDAHGRRSAPVERTVLVTRAALTRKTPAAKPPTSSPAPAPAPTPAADDNGGANKGKGKTERP